MRRGHTLFHYTLGTEWTFYTTINAVAHLGDVSRALDADDMRVLHRVYARTTILIDEVHTRRLDIDEHLTVTRLRGRNLTELECLKREVKMEGRRIVDLGFASAISAADVDRAISASVGKVSIPTDAKS